MSWSKKAGDCFYCTLPSPEEIHEAKAESGSEWTCETCGKKWTLRWGADGGWAGWLWDE